MREPTDTDHAWHAAFGALRERDAREAPAFASMLERARADASTHVVTEHRPWRRTLWLVGAPLLTAAGLGAVWLNGHRRADQEFDQTVAGWTQTVRPALRTPTDRLLAVPGNEYLHTMPTFGGGILDGRSGS